jgi:hypothetical protein
MKPMQEKNSPIHSRICGWVEPSVRSLERRLFSPFFGSLTFWVGKGMASGKLEGHDTPEKLFAELLGLGLKSGASPNAF